MSSIPSLLEQNDFNSPLPVSLVGSTRDPAKLAMPPRKRSNSSSSSAKKSNHQNQTMLHSKYGIQHFFVRHSQQKVLSSSQNHQSDSSGSVSTALRGAQGHELNPILGCQVSGCAAVPGAVQVSLEDPSSSGFSASQPVKMMKNGTDSENSLQDMFLHDAMGMDGDGNESPIQVSPEIPKSLPLKRFKFSPGMVRIPISINQQC